jgi:RNA polymerase sigma factor (sigma-70 family)
MDESDVEAVKSRNNFLEKAEEYAKKLPARIYSWTHDTELTEELVQRVFLKYFEYREAENWQEEIIDELAFITKIARNLLIDIRRFEARNHWISFDAEPGDGLMKEIDQFVENFDVEKKIYFDELLATLPLNTILGKLKPEKAKLVVLYYRKDYSIEEAAAELGVHTDLIKYWISGIEKTIQERVRKLYGKQGLFK